jgi:hypothetical protein
MLFIFFFKQFIIYFKFIYLLISKIILNIILKIKEIELLLFLYSTHIKNDSNKFSYMKNLNINKNIINLVTNYITSYDLLGRSYIILNYGLLKFVLIINVLLDSISFLNKDKIFIEEILLKRNFFKFLFYSTPKSYFFTNLTNIILYIKTSNNILSYNNVLIQLRTMYKDIFIINNFRHSGIFEGV